jgi:hypothetical protein
MVYWECGLRATSHLGLKKESEAPVSFRRPVFQELLLEPPENTSSCSLL